MLKAINFSLVKHYDMNPDYINNMAFFEYQYLIDDIEEWRKEEEKRREEQKRKDEAERRKQEAKYKAHSSAFKKP